MELGWETRPVSLAHHPRDWRSQPGAGPSSVPPSSFSPTSVLPPRRRSSATHVPPPAPPPNQPIPRVPNSLSTSPVSNAAQPFPRLDRTTSHAQPSTLVTTAQSQLPNLEPSISSTENLSDPPRPMPPSQYQAVVPDPSLLSPPGSRHPRPSSRRALTEALELAREAVQLDTTNNDPHGAVVAYGRSVALLSEVMERVRRGEDTAEAPHRRRNGRRRSVVAQEEEVRRLKSIHDTYADRMNILSLIYNIPPIPHSPTSVYASAMSTSTDSMPGSSSVSNSPPSHISDSYTSIDSRSEDPRQRPDNGYILPGIDEPSDAEAIGSAMFARSWDIPDHEPQRALSAESIQYVHNLPPPPYHPYAAVDFPSQTPTTSTNVILPINRTSPHPQSRRPRTASAVPPPPPPPQNLPPPAPAPIALDPPDPPSSQAPRQLDIARTRDATAGHKRTGSGRLAALEEEMEKHDSHPVQDQRQVYHGYQNESMADTGNLPPETPRVVKRDSPLPALPSPTFATSAPDTSRNVSTERPPPSPRTSNVILPRPRGSSTLAVRPETAPQPYLINSSTTMGTISQRRSKASAPPNAGSTSPTEPTAPVPPVAASHKLTASSLPASTAISLGIGRSRASSQPGRRPSLINGRVSPLDQRPPLPATASLNGSIVPRKTSFPSKLNPNNQISQTIIQVDLPFPSGPPTAFIPASFVSQGNPPTTPPSPLPPAPPSDSLRKPYHLMNLLQATMTSKTGGYVTRRLHVPQEVWSQGGAKLTNVLEKVRVVEVLCSALEELQNYSVEYFGAGNVSSGLALGIGSVGRKEGEAWLGRLEDFSSVCDGVVANFGKKLGVGEGFVLKKTSGVTSWGGKLTRQLDKFTNGKNLDSPAAYVLGLSRLFSHAQLLDEHTRALSTQPASAAYAAFPSDVRIAAEAKLRRSSEFFASVVLTFVVRDLSQLLDKYAKKCEKWLAE